MDCLGIVSLNMCQAVDVQIDFNNGFGAAPQSFKILKKIGSVNEEMIFRIARGVSPGPEYVKNVASKLELYFRDKEKKIEKTKHKQ